MTMEIIFQRYKDCGRKVERKTMHFDDAYAAAEALKQLNKDWDYKLKWTKWSVDSTR